MEKGLEVEESTFWRRQRTLKVNAGQFVLIKNTRVIGYFNSRESAEDHARIHIKDPPYFIRRITLDQNQ